MFRKLLVISALVYLTLFLLPRFCYERTGGFWLQTIFSDRPIQSIASHPHLDQINALLAQPFHFLSQGMQSVAFVGADGETILKFFKHRPSLLKKGRLNFQRPHLEPILESYRIAEAYLKEETALLYTHLDPTEGLHPKVTLIDKQHISFPVALDGTEFVVQKRAEPLCATIRKERKSAPELLRSLAGYLKKQQCLGIVNTDPACRRNLGVVGGRIVLLDAGSLHLETGVVKKSDTRNLEMWLRKHYPELHELYKKLLEEE